jgi:hypothetical protein
VSSGSGTFTLAASPASLTVAQGSSANETITVTPKSGYTGTVDLSFDTSNDTALQNLCYEFTNENSAGDGTLAITGTTAGTLQLTMDANASDCNSTTGAMRPVGKQLMHKLHAATAPTKNNPRNPVPMTVAFAGLLLVGFMGRASKRLRGLAAVLLLAAVGLAVTACGSSLNNTLSNPPQGTYTITVTGTDSVTSTITGTTTFTMVIN